jgi:hypothetical protein
VGNLKYPKSKKFFESSKNSKTGIEGYKNNKIICTNYIITAFRCLHVINSFSLEIKSTKLILTLV